MVVTDDSERLREIYGRHQHKDVPFEPSFCAGETMQARERVVNGHVFLQQGAFVAQGLEAARQLWTSARKGEAPDDLADKIWHVVRDLDDVAQFAYRRLISGQRPYAPAATRLPSFSLRSEQAPNPDSRVALAAERDALGLRRARLDWRLTDLDRRTVRVLTETLGAEFARLNNDSVWPDDMFGGNHHMGTTRMAADPKQGVVDADCRVHHIDNLYVAGSSVFPTGGCANPTLTIVALTLRLADHLGVQLA